MVPSKITQAQAKGSRSYQEDFYFVAHYSHGILLGCFDGHGGPEAAEFCYEKTSAMFLANWETMDTCADPGEILRKTIKNLAQALIDYESGSTASLVYIPEIGDEVYTAVIGDSPIIIRPYGTYPGKLCAPTYWHSPDHNVRSNPTEADAVRKRSGYITSDGYAIGRSGHGLQMGRALGDYDLRDILSTEPEVNTVKIGQGAWILVCTDGLIDPGHKSVDAKRVIIDKCNSSEVVAKELVDYAVSVPTGDNVSCILARF